MMIRVLAVTLLIFFMPQALMAQTISDESKAKSLQDLAYETLNPDPIADLAELFDSTDIRLQAMREAALSYGARGGLAKRTEEISQSLIKKSSSMDKIYDFKRLLIPAPSGLLIEPPIVSEGEDATLIEAGGQTAAVVDKIYNINRNARIVSTPRNWRAYLERQWGTVEVPPSVLWPQNGDEKRVWLENLEKGWNEGIKQADEIFQADLNNLIADYSGMIRYRKLLAKGIISAPYALHVDRGITGGGDEMRIGDRAVQITGPSQLMTEGVEWQPVSR
jgi:defect-in-organelle-trafficking protein DotC